MFQLFLLLITAVVAYASTGCSFSLAVSGEVSGSVWQLQNGQLRVGSYHTPAKFTLKNGCIVDSKGSGCILTPRVRQFQCNENQGALPGFSIGENRTLLYNENPNFYACPASELEWNIYTAPVARQLKCTAISINADGCRASKRRVLRRGYSPEFHSSPQEEFVARYRAEFGVDPRIPKSRRPLFPHQSRKKASLPKFDGREFSVPNAGHRLVDQPTSEYDSPEMQYLDPIIAPDYVFLNPAPPPPKSFREKLGLPKFGLPKFGGETASVTEAIPPRKHHQMTSIAALVIPNIIGGVVGGILANALPSLLSQNRHDSKKGGAEAGVGHSKAITNGVIYKVTPSYTASKETAGPIRNKGTKAKGKMGNLVQPSSSITSQDIQGPTTNQPPTTTPSASAPSGFKTEVQTTSALWGDSGAQV